MRKLAALLSILMTLSCISFGPFEIRKVKASGTIYIRASGVVEGTESISRNGTVYTFTANINDQIMVERSDIIIDGSDLTLQGDWNGAGFNLTDVSNVTIQNVKIKNFIFGIYICSSANVTISRNIISENGRDGIRLISSVHNIISENNNMDNYYYGVYLNSSSLTDISKNNVTNNYYGIWLTLSSDNSIVDNRIVNNQEYGIWLRESTDNTISSNYIGSNSIGLYISASSHDNVFLENEVSSCNYGLRIRESTNNTVAYSNVTNNDNYGIYVQRSFNTILRNTSLNDNNFNLAVVGLGLSDFILDIDTSNTVDAKPIYYLVNEQDIEVPSDAGYVALINSTRMVARELQLKSNGEGILLVNSTYSQVEYCDIADNEIGIQLYSSSNNSISGNLIRDNGVYGLAAVSSSNNKIHQNNFFGNANQTYISSGYTNEWYGDYPVGGNFWEDFSGSDLFHGPEQNRTGSDGISDVPNIIDSNNQDIFPLMGPANFFNAGTWNETTYFVSVISNSSLSAFHFNPTDVVKNFRFNVSSSDGSTGFCRVAFPEILLKGPYTVTVDDLPIRISSGASSDEHIFLYFTYNHSTKTAKVIGTDAIPEFPPLAVLPLFFVLIFQVIAVYVRKKKKNIFSVSDQPISPKCSATETMSSMPT